MPTSLKIWFLARRPSSHRTVCLVGGACVLLLTACGLVNPATPKSQRSMMPPEGLQPLNSRYLAYAHYANRTLTVYFHSGAETAILDVPPELYAEFLARGGKLGFLRTEIKSGREFIHLRDSDLRRQQESGEVIHLRYRGPGHQPQRIE